MGDDEVSGYQGWYTPMPEPDPPDWVDGAPTSGRHQHCALCVAPDVRWVHPLDPNLVTYRVYGKGHTLPSFWCLCERCESVYRAHDDDALVDIMKAGSFWSTEEADVTECIVQPLAVFRRADRGARPLTSP